MHTVTWQQCQQSGDNCQVEKFQDYVTAEKRVTDLSEDAKVAYVEWLGHDGKIIQCFDR